MLHLKFVSGNVNPKVERIGARYSIDLRWKSKTRVMSSNPRVASSNPRVTGSNPRVTSTNSRVTNSNPRVRRLKA